MKVYALNENIRAKLKQPLDLLIEGSPEITMPFLKKYIASTKPIKIFIVGDYVTQNSIKYGIDANLYIIDNKIMRKKTETFIPNITEIYRITNPAGTITLNSLKIIEEKSACNSRLVIIVDGEEDLLTLPVIKFSPINSLVLYGQPNVGIVLVKVTKKIKTLIDNLLNQMKV